jgi:hypothetical protein
VVDPAAAVPGSWVRTVTVREDLAVATELLARLAAGSGQRSIGVTDLVSLRRAYYRYLAPELPIPAARQARLDQGRAVHRALAGRLAREGVLEARVRREGIVGRIDILADVPIEVKTAGSFVAPDELAQKRPDHLEQLAMYCALVGGWSGRLLTLLADEQGVHDVQALDVPFGSPERVLNEMRGRAERLRAAWAEARPDRLARCPWFGRGCEFEESRVCGCTGEEPVEPPAILDEVGPIAGREDVQARLRPLVIGAAAFSRPFTLGRFREALYPRRAFFDRTNPAELVASPTPEPRPLPPLPDLYARLTEALESGPPGEVAGLPPRWEEPDEEVVGFRGQPLLVRTSRGWARYRPEELVARQPQYALELGLRCAVTGTDRGRLVVGFERAETDRDRLQVLELTFGSVTPFSRFLRERSRALATALRDQSPLGLASCPEWMANDCPYRAACGCGQPS